MNVMIAGGSGFLGKALTQSLLADGHKVFILTRSGNAPAEAQPVRWDGKTTNGWGSLMNEMDAVVHLAGKSLASFPWTAAVKQAFQDSRVLPGLALTQAVQEAERRPRVFVQASGINHYGLKGGIADEDTPPGGDFLAQLTVKWEAATQPVEKLGVRRVILRTAVALGKGEGMLGLMALPVKLFAGGPIGDGKFCMPWIHVKDWVGAARYLMSNESASGAYNLIAPTPTSNAEFNRALAAVLRRPYWLPAPAFLLRTFLGEMSVLVVEGRCARPKRLLEAGYKFQFETAREALRDLFG
ncbi:MAG: TIGR01777 family oxidoreductase [Chloroflexi bacterium]|nr:TIGR01777 family oxidoreductase [Chloroflexota bacterium]MCA2001302.1 TIGR01777 family oxidoreductase [Chloroflexota bacterium]